MVAVIILVSLFPSFLLSFEVKNFPWRRIFSSNAFSLYSTTSIELMRSDSYLLSLRRHNNISFSEWSVATNHFDQNTDNISSFVLQSFELGGSNSNSTDKGEQSSWGSFREFCDYNFDYELAASMFRRNIALRANRVLHPARNAQIFTALINLMISANLLEQLRDMLGYIGLTVPNYVQLLPSGDSEIHVAETINYISRKMLELDLDRMSWVLRGRPLEDEPSTPKSRGESVQEWLYTQVHRSDLGYRVCDMTMAVIRLAVRIAILHSQSTFSKRQESEPNLEKSINRIEIVIATEKLEPFISSGIPMGHDFLSRLQDLIVHDINVLKNESDFYFPNINILTK